MKRILIGIGILIAIILLIWGICETVGSDYYNYQGYITDVLENETGETVIVTISGTGTSEFIVKSYTRIKGPKKTPFGVGDHVMLSTTRYSDINLKKIKIDVGYATEGKLVYTEAAPFLLTVSQETETSLLVNIVAQNDILSNLKTGDTIRVYHATPLYQIAPVHKTPLTIITDSVSLTETGSELTAEEIAFIESQGYTIK